MVPYDIIYDVRLMAHELLLQIDQMFQSHSSEIFCQGRHMSYKTSVAEKLAFKNSCKLGTIHLFCPLSLRDEKAKLRAF